MKPMILVDSNSESLNLKRPLDSRNRFVILFHDLNRPATMSSITLIALAVERTVIPLRRKNFFTAMAMISDFLVPLEPLSSPRPKQTARPVMLFGWWNDKYLQLGKRLVGLHMTRFRTLTFV